MKQIHLKSVLTIMFLTFALPSLSHAKGKGGGLGNLNPERIDRMAEKLSLSPDTTERIKNLVFTNQKKRIEIEAKAKSAQLELRRQLDQDTPDRDRIMSQIQGLGTHQIDMRKLRVGLLLDIRSLLTADQRRGLKKMLRRGKRGKHARRGGKRGKRRGKGKRQRQSEHAVDGDGSDF